jgi:hypothetical protein
VREGELIDWLVEFHSESEMGERGREVIDWAIDGSIEIRIEGEMGDRMWKIIYWVGKSPSNSEMGKRSGESIDCLSKCISYDQVNEIRGKLCNWMIESIS